MSKRSKMVRYSPARAKELREEIAKHPNQDFRRMLQEGRMTDGDLVDFAFNVAHAYFSGALLEPCRQAALADMDRLLRRTVLVIAASFNRTATFAEDGDIILTPAWSDDDPDVQAAAVQALIDTGMTLKSAMSQFPGPEQDQMQDQEQEPIHARLPAAIH